MVVPILIAAVISVLIGIFPDAVRQGGGGGIKVKLFSHPSPQTLAGMVLNS